MNQSSLDPGRIMQVSGCDIADHHPRWENIYRTLRVHLGTASPTGMCS
ncbi:MAG: hypothetical protein ABW298_14545 [Candidatus Binatia bacterium]